MKINVLDKGFVRLLNVASAIPRQLEPFMGDLDFGVDRFSARDTDPATCARISFDNFEEERTEDQDMKLVRYLMANSHNTPLEMTVIWLEMKLPIFIARQFIRHRVSSVNEVSARYTKLPADWYIPEIVGAKPTNGMKQGQENTLSEQDQNEFKESLDEICSKSYYAYETAISKGVAPEHARLFLHTNHYCVHVDTPILTNDLRWVKAGDLNKNSLLLGFEESPRKSTCKRRYVESKITDFSIQEDLLFKIELSNGDTVTCNGEHKWLVRYKTGGGSKWISTKTLQSNPDLWVFLKLFTPWEDAKTFDEGYLSAAMDGEGYLTYVNGNGRALGFTQNENSMLDKVRGIFNDFNIAWTEQTNNVSGTKNLRISGGINSIIELLGILRPPRIIDKWLSNIGGSLIAKEFPTIISITEVEVGKIASFSTSSKTYIANGYPCHNTHWIWKQDLHNLLHFLSLRLDPHAQVEARAYAKAIYDLLETQLPKTMALFKELRLNH